MTPWGIFANILSSKFTWTEHIEYVSKKINQRLGLLRRIKSLLPRSASILFFNSLFLSIFDYADIVWEGWGQCCSHEQFTTPAEQGCQNYIRPPFSLIFAADALEALGWLTLGKRRLFYLCLYVYKRVNKISAHSMDLLANKDVHGYDTRHKDNQRLPRVRKNWENKGPIVK